MLNVQPSGRPSAPQRPETGAEEPVVQVHNLTYAFPGSDPVLQDLSIDFRPGSITSIIGPSGCVKSTLLYLLAGIYQPISGGIQWSESDQNRVPITMMFQKDTLLPWLTAAKNVELYSVVGRHKPPKSEAKQRVKELLELAGLTAAADRYPHQLSGGMRRRAMFLSAIAPSPRVVLLDEPFSSLDEPTRISIHQDVREIAHKADITVILVTHDLAEAVSMSDDVVVMAAHPGRIVRHETIDLGDERDMFSLREDPRFLELYGDLWHGLKSQIRGDAK
jgi:NitT/TauT family transport system ATP-binding protein